MKINGIIIEPCGVHPAIIARIVDYTIQNHTVYWIEEDDTGRWEGEKVLPEKIYDITADRETGVMFRVILADGRDELSGLGASGSMELERQGWL